MSIAGLHGITIAYGGPPILDDISLDIHKGQRVCILGRNGAGKSTLMRVIAGLTIPDSGQVVLAPGVSVSYLPQNVPDCMTGTVFEVVASGAGDPGEKLALMHRLGATHTAPSLLSALQHYLDDHNGWGLQTAVDRVIGNLKLGSESDVALLSGGMRRRVLLARALVGEPELLLLDEPTNHLDIESIAWLESFILGSRLTLMFVTHDRRLLKRIATRIIEVDRGKIVDWSCDYETFLKRKQSVLDAEEKQWARFDKKLAQEEVWIRRGIKARRTRNMGRVHELARLREERRKRRERSTAVSMAISDAQRSGNLVLEAHHVSFSYGETPIINDLNIAITRRDRIGIIGPNGSGKTTLLNLLLGRIPPDTGAIRAGTNLKVSYFDQLREVLDPEKTVWENVAPGGADTVFINGKPKHVISYLQDFLFTADRARSPVKQLSGGERNRLMLARVFTQPANVLVFDEPTNDLDAETLELLEELLGVYDGTILVVSHDREFLNNVATSILAFEGGGVFREYVGGFDDWERQTAGRAATLPHPEQREKPAVPRREPQGPKKLSYREKKELDALPAAIEELEKEYDSITRRMSDPVFAADAEFLGHARQRIPWLEQELARAYQRWEELEGRPG